MRRFLNQAWLPALALLLAVGCGGGGGTTVVEVPGPPGNDVPFVPDITAGITIVPGCTPGTATILNNGIGVCTVTVSLALDEPVADFPAISVDVSGPAGVFFYSNPSTGIEPIASGRAPRSYSVSFNPATGLATLMLYIRSTAAAGNQNITIQSGASFTTNATVAFAAAPPAPVISVDSVSIDSACQAGMGTIEADGIELCAVTLDLNMAPAQNGFQIVTAVSAARSGLLFYASDVSPIGNGMAPRNFTMTFDGTGDAVLTFYIRSTTDGQTAITMSSGGAFTQMATVEFAAMAAPPTIMGSASVDASCQQGLSTIEANLDDFCLVTLDLTATPMAAYQLVLQATGPSGVLFYDNDTDPVGSGMAVHTYLADFNGSGVATVEAYVRSSSVFSSNLAFSSAPYSATAPVQFIATQAPPTVGSSAVTGIECQTSDPTATNNGLDLCHITLTLTASMAPVNFNLSASGPAGYLFSQSDTDPVDSGTAPGIYSVNLTTTAPTDVDIWLRSTRAGNGTVRLLADGILDINQSVAFLADGTFVPPELVIGDECTPAIATAQANGLSTCLLTLNLTLSPPEPDFFDIAVSVGSDSSYLFYESLSEPVNQGQTTRIFPVSFDPGTGLASLQVYVRSNTPGPGAVTFLSGGRIDVTDMIEFQPDTSAPASIELIANSFVGNGGSTDVIAIVKNALGDPIPSSAQQFTVDFTSNDASGLFAPPHPTIVRAGQDNTDNNGEAMAVFSTQNFNAHAVTITASISAPVVSVPPAQVMISVFDQLSAAAIADYQVVGIAVEGRPGNITAAASEEIDGFFGAGAGQADRIEIDVQIRSVDEVAAGMDCNCDTEVDPNACTDMGEIACPLNIAVELDCPTGLGNPAQNQCQFNLASTFMPISSGCTNGVNGACVKFTCPGGASTCEQTIFMRVVTNSVAKQSGILSNTHAIRPRIFAGGVQFAANDINRTDPGPGQMMPVADSVLFYPDSLLPAEAFFTKPVCALGAGGTACTGGAGDATDGGLNQNCTVLTTDPTAAMTVVSCSNNAAHYTLPETDPLRPRFPVWFDLFRVIGDPLDPTDMFGDGATPVTFSFDGPSGTGLDYRLCNDAASSSSCFPSMDGDINPAGLTLAQAADRYLYPPFSPTPFGGASGIDVTVSVPGVTGFAPASKKILVNPQCNTPYAIDCRFTHDDAVSPSGPPTCFTARGLEMPARTLAYADGAECEYVECRVVSYAQSVPGAGPTIGPVTCNEEVVPDGLYSMFVQDDGDTEVETFCPAGGGCTAGAFVAMTSLAISTQRARFYVRVNNNQTAAASIQADFHVRLRKADETDLAPVNLIEQTPPFTMGRDPSLPASLQIAFQDSGGAPAAAIYTQYVADGGVAPEITNFYGLLGDSRFQDPFAARVHVTIKDFNGADYTNPGDNPTCQVNLTASGTAAGTMFPALNGPDCQTPLPARTLTQTSGNPLVSACVISNGNASAATATATITATFAGGCTTGMNSAPITVRSVARSARFRYDVVNSVASTVAFTGLQANATISSTVFCLPSDGDCADVPQPEDFFPIDLLAAKGPQGNLVEGMGLPQIRGIYAEIPPGVCTNAFSIASLATRGVWSFDLSLHPDTDGDGAGSLAELLDRLNYDVSTAPVPALVSQEFTQQFNPGSGCTFGTIGQLNFNILTGTPLYFGGP